MYLHKRIRRFSLDGQIYDDSMIPRLHSSYLDLISTSMRIKGYVPRLDIDPDWTIEYTGKNYNFKLSVYGVFVGKRKAQEIWALDKQRIISTPQNKSKEPSNQQA
jgi:hypothetical protein